ncbi:MAG: hypothetical protein HY741_00685 [Chloroflexi bacterium]|nr:hypothetical protein [Chloroflexota bacterium]
MAFIPPSRHPLVLAPVVVHAANDFVRGAPAPFSALTSKFAQAFFPPPRVLDVQCIPAADPFLLVFNHYETARVAAWWAPLLAANVIAAQRVETSREIHFVMAREWWYPGGFGRYVKQPLMQWLLARFARVYDFVTVPPILDAISTRGEGAGGVRRALALTRGDTAALVGIAPEGHSGPNGQLCEPPAGAGIFLLWLAREKIPLLPLGIYEDSATLTLRFGAPFYLQDSRALDRTERDRAATVRVMGALAALLPEALRGMYATPPDDERLEIAV